MSPQSTNTRSRSAATGCALALIVSIALLAQPLFFQRIIPQWDYFLHLRWSGEFTAILREGVIFPKWAYASHGGLGDPTFLYYQPLIYYVASAFAAFGLSAVSALLWAAWIPFLLLGIVTARIVAREAPLGTVLLAVAFVVASPAPLLLYSQTAAFPWVFGLPFGVLFVVEAVHRRPALGRASLWFALLCLSHILSGLMVLVITAICRLLLFRMDRDAITGHARFVAVVGLGMALAGFYVLPALTLQGLINPKGWQVDPYLDWHRGFSFPTWTFARYGWNWFSLQVPLPLLALGMSSAVLLSGRRANSAHPGSTAPRLVARRLAIASLVGVAMSSELAYPVYDLVGPLQKLQHPYRFAVISEVLAGLALVLHLVSLRRAPVRHRRFAVVGIAVAFTGVLMTLYLETSILRAGSTSPTYEAVIGGDFGPIEYWPATMGSEWRSYNDAGGFAAECRRLGIACERPSPDVSSFRALVDAPGPVRLRLPLFAFPAWRTEVDGVVAPTTTDAVTGVVALELPAGRHEVVVRWVSLPAEWIGRAFSIAALCFFGVRGLSRRRRSTPPREPTRA